MEITKRVITADDINNDPIIRAVRAKRDEIEKIRTDKDAYINRVISEMNAEISWTPESIAERIELAEKELIESHIDPENIVDKFRIEIPDTMLATYTNTMKKCLDDENLKQKVCDAFLLSKKTYRQAVVDAWNKKHPALPGKLTTKSIYGSRGEEETSLLISNKIEK